MQAAAFHFAGGDAFFSGIAAILVAEMLFSRQFTQRGRRAARFPAVIGGLFVALSATPLPVWFYGIWGTFFCVWLYFESRPFSAAQRRMSVRLNIVTGLMCLIALGMEVPYRTMDRSGDKQYSTLMIIGDSISAGSLGSKEQTWPKRFRQKYGVDVIDVSHVGATARSAFQQAKQLEPHPAGLVVIEIGGNDFFGETSGDQFEKDLEALLQVLHQPERRLVMLELPLPPLYNGYGRIQRALAKRFGVTLIPRRRLMQVLSTNGATLDTIHLSEKGHEMMADMIWQQIGPWLTSQ